MALTTPSKVLIAVIGAGMLVYGAKRSGVLDRLAPSGAAPGSPSPGADRPRPGVKVTVDFLYTTEKEKWLNGALAEFERANPEIAVRAKGMGTIESVRAIAEGREKPVVWSPADEVAINLLETEWQLLKGTSVVDRSATNAPQPLLVTPLVMIAWEDRARTLSAASKGDPTNWKTIHELAVNPKGWTAFGGPPEWGFVKLGFTAPNLSNSGLQTLILMTYGYHGKRAGLVPADALDAGYQKWIKEIATAVGKFSHSSGTYMKEMVLFGPSKYDVIWNYEATAIGDMASAQGRWGNLQVFYPQPTLWSNHPFVLLTGDWVTAEQRAAAAKLRDFLLSQPVQQRALDFGFRPANPDVRVLSPDPNNPFNRLKPFGLRVDIPPTAEPPSGEVTRLLLETWRRVVGTPAT